MSQNTELAAARLKALQGRQEMLSFGGGIENSLGIRHTKKSIRLRIENGFDTEQIIYLCPKKLLGEEVVKTTITTAVDEVTGAVRSVDEEKNINVAAFGLPSGTPFFVGEIVPDDEEGVALGLSLRIKPLSPGQNLDHLGSALAEEETQVVAISMKSFTEGGQPENTNYGNSLTHYKLSHLKEIERTGDLNFEAFQNSRDVSTEIMKIDLIKNNFNAIITQNDVLAIQVNPKTKMDLTLHLGARFSRSEYFYRQVAAANQTLLESFPHESAVGQNC